MTYKIATLNKISGKGMSLLTDQYEVIDDPKGADGIIVRSQDMHEMELKKPLLSIARAGAGYNNIPVEACTEKGIVVFNTPGANANGVKELVIAGLLLAARNIPEALDWAKTLGKDAASVVEKGKSKFAGEELQGKVLAVIGLGAIGVLVANAAENLGMKVVGFDPYLSVKAAHDLSPSVRIFDKLESLLPHADYVTIHVPASKDTNGMINYEVIDAMKNKAVLLNFSRDKLVDTEGLKRALAEKKLRLYVTDFPIDDIVGLNNVLLIPHLGASTKESEENCAVMAVEQTVDYIEHGNIENSVNFPAVSMGLLPEGVSRVIIIHKNVPGTIGLLSGAIAELGFNIENLTNKSKGEYAVSVLDIHAKVKKPEILAAIDSDDIISVRVI
ncbi:MAG: 3-phosphoglycerate dehydrogenase [Clostridiales Family XIII bacterium]|jgi:D-3-phosphoglycerate dehydrogenase|nr:3-phosphoglycerate dehydrogenase [Clostridiales Family XIII bacterium]